jgi:hypothetical protein
MKKKLSKKNGKLKLKSKNTKLAPKSRAERYPLSNDKLEALATNHKPARIWYEEEKEQILGLGWKIVQEARARTKGISQKTIGKIIDAAVRKVRGRKK